MSRQLVNLTTDSNPVGRPLELDQKVVAVANDYVKNYAKYGDVAPSVAGLAFRLSKDKTTLYRWVKENRSEDFNNAMRQISSAQERSLLNGGLSGEFNASITKLCLATNHGYSENNQQDTAVTVNVNRDSVEITTKGQTLSVEDTE